MAEVNVTRESLQAFAVPYVYVVVEGSGNRKVIQTPECPGPDVFVDPFGDIDAYIQNGCYPDHMLHRQRCSESVLRATQGKVCSLLAVWSPAGTAVETAAGVATGAATGAATSSALRVIDSTGRWSDGVLQSQVGCSCIRSTP